MPYVALEDVHTTRRGSLSGRRRLQAWERTGGTCVVCGLRIDGVRERWIVEHMRALELGGADEIENMGPAHEACGREKTRNDHARAAEAKRQKLRHLGAAVIARPLPGSRCGALKRKVDGTVVPRERRIRSHVADDPEPEVHEASVPASKPSLFGRTPRQIDQLCSRRMPSEEKVESESRDQMPNRAAATPDATVGTPEDVAALSKDRPAFPGRFDFLFNDRPLLPEENAQQYEALLHSILQQIVPSDVIEALWVKNITDFIWEANQIRRWRRQILIQAQLQVTEDLIRPDLRRAIPRDSDQLTAPTADVLAGGCMAGSKKEKGQVEVILHERGFTAENATAHGFLLNLPSIELIDRLASLADQRRDALLREIERKRSSLGGPTRKVATDAA